MMVMPVFLVMTAAVLSASESAPVRLAEFTRGVHAAAGTFEQVVVDSAGRRAGASRGTFALKAPYAFRWQEAWPSPSLILAPPFRQGDADPLLWDASAVSRARFLVSLFDHGTLARHFTMYQTANRDGLVWLHLSPRAPTSDLLFIDLGFDEEVLRRMDATDTTGKVVELRFSSWKMNPRLPDTLFLPSS